jgi:CO/xanthine dehydrogenase Mo-binding subunit
VAVLHEKPSEARKALAQVKATFEGAEPAVDDATIFAHLVAKSPELKPGTPQGNLKEGEDRATLLVPGEYLNAYVAHAPMEPHTAVARWEDGRMTVWTSTQAPFPAKAQVAQALGLPADKVRIITPYVGGAFGGKLPPAPHAVEAARLAKAMGMGRPVQVAWSRKEEFFLDTYRPAAVVKVRSGLDRDGHISFWDYQVFGTSDREADIGYTLPNRSIRSTGDNSGGPGLHPVLTGAWRAPAANTNVFARESHMDVLAARAKTDPVAFRLAHLTNPRTIRLLKQVADRFGWIAGPGPTGRGQGVAIGAWRGTLAVAMAEVAVDRATGQVVVKRLVQGLDLGLVVNPDGARQQIEGGATMGLGYALSEGLRFKGGHVLDENFDTYTLPRFSWLPKIEVVFGDSPDLPSQGCGEPAIVCMGAVLANAVHDAVGARVCHLPMTPAKILEALGKS